MKTSVRFLSLLLAVLMIAGAALTASAEKAEKIANEEALSFLVKLGVFGGYEDGSLRPDNKVERDEMAKIIFTLSTTFTDAGAGTVSFADVPAGDWSAGYISWCSASGIVGGYGNGKFGPNDYVTYNQALKMVAGALGYKEWNSNLWPTDVRMVALTQLGLGENLDSVKGDDYVTRAQIAQIVYNAFSANMKTTKKGAYGSEVPMTLKTDVWGVNEVPDKIVAAENFYLTGNTATEKEDVVVLNTYGKATLEEIGLDAYKGKTDDIIGAEVNVIYRGEDVLGTTIKSIYSDDVELTTDKEGKNYINGVEINSENPVNMIAIDNNGKVTETTLVMPADYKYVIKACDTDADGDFDTVYYSYYTAGVVKTVGKTNTTFDNLSNGIAADISVKNELLTSAVALAEDDVVVFIKNGPKVEIVDVVEPITATVTKFGNNKITFGGKEYEVNKDVFVNLLPTALDTTVMNKDVDGNAVEFDFYAYDGKVFYSTAKAEEAGDLNFAVLAYVNTPAIPVLDPIKQTYTTAYTAVLVINGKETKIDLNGDKTIVKADGTELSMVDHLDEIMATYGKEEHVNGNGYLVSPYTLVTYTKNDDGYYTLKLLGEGEDYLVIEPGATFGVDSDLTLYSVAGTDLNGDPFTDGKILMNDKSAIYYTYTKPKETGDHLYLGVYTKANILKDFVEKTTTGYTYLYKGENDKLYTLVATIFEEELTNTVVSTDFKTDGRLIKYAYADSNKELFVEDGNKIYYSYSLMDLTTLANKEALDTTKSVADGAVSMTAGCFYAWDAENEVYVKIDAASAAALGVESVTAAKLVDVFSHDSKNYIYTEEGSKFATGVEVPASATVWTLSSKNTSGASLSSYKKLDYAALENLLELAAEKSLDVRLIIFTYENDKGEEIVSSVIVEYYTVDYSEKEEGEVTTYNKTIHTKFGA